MNTLSKAARIAIINWKEFHASGLNKKRRIHDLYGSKRVGFLNASHYIIMNILRGLPPERGLIITSDVFINAYNEILNLEAKQTWKTSPLSMPFGLTGWELMNLLKSTRNKV